MDEELNKEIKRNYDKKIENVFKCLKKSKFRSSFSLKEKDKEYVREKGLEEIKEHAYDFVLKRIAPEIIPNDGKQTPMKGHPVFIAQHATATCCRGCIYKWHKIPIRRALKKEEIEYIVQVIMKWIEKANGFVVCPKNSRTDVKNMADFVSDKPELLGVTEGLAKINDEIEKRIDKTVTVTTKEKDNYNEMER